MLLSSFPPGASLSCRIVLCRHLPQWTLHFPAKLIFSQSIVNCVVKCPIDGMLKNLKEINPIVLLHTFYLRVHLFYFFVIRRSGIYCGECRKGIKGKKKSYSIIHNKMFLYYIIIFVILSWPRCYITIRSTNLASWNTFSTYVEEMGKRKCHASGHNFPFLRIS